MVSLLTVHQYHCIIFLFLFMVLAVCNEGQIKEWFQKILKISVNNCHREQQPIKGDVKMH